VQRLREWCGRRGRSRPLSERRWKVSSEKEEREVSHGLDAILVEAAKSTADSAVRTFKIHEDTLGRREVRVLQEIAQAPAAIAEVPEEEGWKLLVRYNREIRDILLERSEGDRARERKEDWKYWLGLAVAIILALVGWAIALGIIQWSPGG